MPERPRDSASVTREITWCMEEQNLLMRELVATIRETTSQIDEPIRLVQPEGTALQKVFAAKLKCPRMNRY